MNIEIENLGPCKKLIRVDIPADTVSERTETTIREFGKHVSLPGFRPGKAPKHLILKSYSEKVDSEVRRQLVNDGYRQAIKEKDLHIVGSPDVEEIQFAKGQPFQFAVTVETAPSFELPTYKAVKIQKEIRSVSEEDVDRAMGVLQDRQAKFETVERGIEENDYAILDYSGQCDGKPITETAPKATSLEKKDDFWLHVHEGQFLPGFHEPLIGLKAGEQKTITLTAPEDFVIKELASKELSFDVTIKEVKVKQLPEITDEFAKQYGAENTEALREGVFNDLENELNTTQKRKVRDQLIKHYSPQYNANYQKVSSIRKPRTWCMSWFARTSSEGSPRKPLMRRRTKFTLPRRPARRIGSR